MADSISIVMKMNDDISGTLKSIASTSKGVSKEFEALSNRTEALGKRYAYFNQLSAKTSAEALEVKRAMDEASKSFKKTGEEADRVRFQQLREEYQALTDSAKTYSEQAKQTQKVMRETYDQTRKLGDDAGGSGGFLNRIFGSDLGGKLSQAGIAMMLGNVASSGVDVFSESIFGQPTATLSSSIISGITSGAAAGAMAGIPVIGAVAGGISGVASGALQIYQQKDDAFKSYVQDAAENALSEQAIGITAGTETIAQRELDAIAFDRLLSGQGDEFLAGLRETAARTPFEYADLTTMARSLATGFSEDPDRMLELMTAIGDAGAAVGASISDMQWMATALSRMQSTDLAQLGEINMFQDRGVNVIGMLADAFGVSEGDMRSMISGGDVSGRKAVDIIQAGLTDADGPYAGSMGLMAETYSGLTSTLQDAQTEADAAYGIGYTEARNEGLQAQIDWLSGESGAAVEEANRAIGAWKAELENQKEQYIRDAVDAMMASDEYQSAKAAGDAAEMGRLIMQAKVQGMSDYNASEGAQEALAAEKALVDGIRYDTSLNQDYWDAGYEKGQWYSKGRTAATLEHMAEDLAAPAQKSEALSDYMSIGEIMASSHAYGLKYVPHDNYPILAHQGERLLTAQEARAQDRAGAGGVSVTITGPVTVRQDSDIDAIAVRLADEIEARALAYGG